MLHKFVFIYCRQNRLPCQNKLRAHLKIHQTETTLNTSLSCVLQVNSVEHLRKNSILQRYWRNIIKEKCLAIRFWGDLQPVPFVGQVMDQILVADRVRWVKNKFTHYITIISENEWNGRQNYMPDQPERIKIN